MTARFALVIFLVVSAAVLIWHYAARAETVPEWIHRTHHQCCDHRDCFPVRATKLPVGWLVQWHGREVPYNGPTLSSPADTWACGTPTTIRCLLLGGGTS